MKNRIIALVSAVVLSLSAFGMSNSFWDGVVIEANAATDAWGRDYETYGSLKYWEKSDGTIGILGFDVNQSEVNIPDKINGKIVSEIIKRYFFVIKSAVHIPFFHVFIAKRKHLF